jgi:hypothetical protein
VAVEAGEAPVEQQQFPEEHAPLFVWHLDRIQPALHTAKPALSGPALIALVETRSREEGEKELEYRQGQRVIVTNRPGKHDLVPEPSRWPAEQARIVFPVP